MNLKLTKLLISLSIISGNTKKHSAQVTIGSCTPATSGALLDIRETYTYGDELTNSTKGLIYPRVALISINNLAPLITNATEEQNKQATGMTVFNTTINYSENLIHGIYLWNGKQWVLGIDTKGNAQFNVITDNNISINGAYFKGEALNQENYLSITFIVTSPGKYKISATTTNGYYFISSGEFLTSGKNVIKIPGTGFPLKSSEELKNPDKITIKINSQEKVEFSNTVLEIPSAFTMNCSSINTFGIFKPNKLLSQNEYIAIQISSTPNALGAKYSIKSDQINGYSFYTEGTISGTKQSVYLYPEIGIEKPQESGIDYFTLTSNSSSNTSTCNFSIPVISSTLSINSYGNWNSPQNVIKPLIEDSKFFSPNGLYKTEGINYTYRVNSNNEINKNFNKDGVFVSYPSTFSNNSQITNAVNYINAGKAMLYARDLGNRNDVESFLSKVFEVPSSNIEISNKTSSEQAYFVKSDNPILKGPFGNISGGSIPADGVGNFSVRINHPDFIPIANTSEGYSRIFMHRKKGLIFIGDGGPYGTNMNWINKNTFLLNIIAWMCDIKNKKSSS